MAKNKLAKFADLAQYPHVFQYPYSVIENVPFEMRGRWHSDFFHNQNPIVLELGCGRGEYAFGLAQCYPEKNFIGIDIKGARLWTGATQSLQDGLTNVAFLRAQIELIERFFAAGEVSEIWLTFSDPQMKKATKRLTSSYFLTRYRSFLIDKGIIHVKTDSNFLYTYTNNLVEKNNLPMLFNTIDLYHDEFTADMPEDEAKILSIKTYYEQQWIARGMKIKYLKFELPHNMVLNEPEIDIELDEYRSYNRSKRSGLITSR